MYLEPCQRLNLLLLWPSFQPWSMQSWQMLEFWIIHLLFKKTHGTSSCCSVNQSCPTFCDPMDCSTPGFSVLHHLLELVQTQVHKSVMPSSHLILCHPFLLLRSIFRTIRVFSNESALCIRWPKYWSFSFSINPSREYSRLISFKIDWFDLLAVQDFQ